MWGGMKGKLPFIIQDVCLEYSDMAKAKGGDQDFLAEKVWPEVQKSGYVLQFFRCIFIFCAIFQPARCALGTSLTAATPTAMILRDFLSQRDLGIHVNSSDVLVRRLNSPHFTKRPPTFRCSLAIKTSVHWSAGRLDTLNGNTASPYSKTCKA